MNISNLITKLQNMFDGSGSPLDYQILSKVIEKLKVGKINVVQTFNNLPDNLKTDGNVFLVESEEELYYNIGNVFNVITKENVSVIYSWGYNGSGRLGDGTEAPRSSPVTVVGGITNWSQVSGAGRTFVTNFGLGLTDDGIAYAWGNNGVGQLGNNDSGFNADRSSPVVVSGGISNWKQVVATEGQSGFGLTDDGIAYAWGNNQQGSLGDGTTTNRSSPVMVVGNITNWSQVSGGNRHALGITNDGIAYAWGNNTKGQLGDNTTTDRSSPVTVIGGISNWSQVSAGQNFNLGLTDSGIAYAWGDNFSGRLGDGTTTDRSSPVTVIGGITNWSQVSGGDFFSLGLTDDGIAYAWGYNRWGNIGDGTTTNRSSPVTVIGGISNWSQVSSGQQHSLGLTDSGIAYAWGNNQQGSLGDGTTTNRSSPVTVIGGITGWSELSNNSGNSAIVIQIKSFLQ